MFASHTLNKLLAGSAVVVAGFAFASSAAAGPIDWASWSGATTGNTTGSATASYDSGLTASYTGELQSLVINYPSYAPASTFSGGTVSNAPAQADGILQIFGGTAAGTNTITFSQAVLNPVLAIWSLGQTGIKAEFDFNTSFVIESGGPSAEYGGTSITSVGNKVFGVEGNGVIQFDGSVKSITWTNPVFENWYGFTLGVPVAAVPEPETYALMLAGLAALGAVARRRRKA